MNCYQCLPSHMMLQESVGVQACVVHGKTSAIVHQHFLATYL